MLWKEKLMEQAVDLEQTVAIQTQRVAFGRQEAPLRKRLQRRSEFRSDVRPKFIFEVAHAEAAEFHLQDEFADQALLAAGRQGAMDRELALVERGQIFAEAVAVLEMRAADVSE